MSEHVLDAHLWAGQVNWPRHGVRSSGVGRLEGLWILGDHSDVSELVGRLQLAQAAFEEALIA